MDMQPVESSNIQEVGYDPETLTLRVRFKSGSTYDYPNVPPETHQEFMRADSPGRHHAQFIKPLDNTRVE